MAVNKQLVVINVVGLTPALIGAHTPHLNRLINNGFISALNGVFPALTTTAQSSMLTGLTPAEHGIVGNGWYDRELAEVMFWKQSNHLVHGEKVWDRLKRQFPDFRCSKLFWWYNMYANVDASITPRPHYPADGRKIIDLYSTPSGLHQQIEAKLGKFPFFNFWGPKSNIESSRWITKAAMLEFEMHQPHLQLVYLPHLDYSLQKLGPASAEIATELMAVDRLVGELMEFYFERGVQLMVVSEYGIDAVDTPVHINRVLREHGYITVRDSLTWELLDPGASRAFAVADHQIAHIYLRDSSDKTAVKQLLKQTPGIEQVLDDDDKKRLHLDHARAGDLIAVAERHAWFSYYYWLDDAKAADFARTVDIHRKPGYDPVELFVDPQLPLPAIKVMWRLLQKALGFRMLMDVIPLDATLVRGSHGRTPVSAHYGPLIIGPSFMARDHIDQSDVFELICEAF